MKQELILEIGIEEIPAGFLTKAIEDLTVIALKNLTEVGLTPKITESFGTPRRLVLHATGLEKKQPDRTVETLGPPKRIAFDENGKYSKAALGFAKKQGVKASELELIETEKGEFLGVRKKIKGEKTETVLKTLLPQIILSIPWRKSMKWGSNDETFVRPIRWILAILGGKKIKFSLGSVESGSLSRGHRFLSPGPFKVTDWKGYLKRLKEGYVVVDQDKRRELIIKGVEKISAKLGGTVEPDEELFDIVTNLVEYPVVLSGGFEEEFLKLPKETLISVMKNHQKYFPVYSSKKGEKALLPKFIFVSGTKVKSPKVVIKGNERVIRARFSDADFFFEEDSKRPLGAYTESLKDMVFLSGLGTYYDKTQRLRQIAQNLAKDLGLAEADAKKLGRAAELSKADLTTQMVFEFPELEGTMGRYYAQLSGEYSEVAVAIEEHYMPRNREDDLPYSELGSLLSITDKIDNISTCFLAGLTPTGTSDPYALRRQAIGVINIILNKNLPLNLESVFKSTVELVQKQVETNAAGKSKFSSTEDALSGIIEFVNERFKNIMVTQGYSPDVVDAVISCDANDLVSAGLKIDALAAFTKAQGFDSLSVAFKRVVNIAKEDPKKKTEQKLFREVEEKSLYQSFTRLKKTVQSSASDQDYTSSLNAMKDLKEPIDSFFDKVLVMDKNEKIRRNRLALLWEIRQLFFTVADFSKISSKSE